MYQVNGKIKKKRTDRTDTYFTKAFCFHLIEFVAPTTTALFLASIISEIMHTIERKLNPYPMNYILFYSCSSCPVFIPVLVHIFLSVPTHEKQEAIRGKALVLFYICFVLFFLNKDMNKIGQ